MITSFKFFEKNEVYFKPGDYVKEFAGDIILKVLTSAYRNGNIRYELQDILNGKIYTMWHSNDIEPATEQEVEIYLMKKDTEKYNL